MKINFNEFFVLVKKFGHIWVKKIGEKFNVSRQRVHQFLNQSVSYLASQKKYQEKRKNNKLKK